MDLNLSAGTAHRQHRGGDYSSRRAGRMIRQNASGLAIKIMRYLNNLERDRTQNRIPLLLIALCATLS